MNEVLSLLIPWGVGVIAVHGILRRDERRMGAKLAARAWPAASRLSAIVNFGELCLPVHFVRTRRSLRGAALGVAWAVGVGLLRWWISELLEG
jgi:hypothetical protein